MDAQPGRAADKAADASDGRVARPRSRSGEAAERAVARQNRGSIAQSDFVDGHVPES